tara:strand:- start:13207 stop:13461 length:255 start_codon:yes stop_codon:yes gene_type:complete
MNATSSNNPTVQEEFEKTFEDLLYELSQEDKDIIEEEMFTQRQVSSDFWYSKFKDLRLEIESIINEVETLDSQVLTKNKLKKLL